jgi:hypothetical protein
LLGRAEHEVTTAFLSLVISGRAAGAIGKSTLIGLARRRAGEQGLTVLAATGVSAESRLPFSGLPQLLRLARDDINALSPARCDALRSAFGQGTGPVLDRFLVAAAVTELLAAAAARPCC